VTGTLGTGVNAIGSRPPHGRHGDLEHGVLAEELRHADRRPRGVRLGDELAVDGEERLDVLAKADMVRGHLDDVGPRRLRFAEHGRDIAVELPELLGDVGGEIAVGRAAVRAGDVDRVADAKTRRVRDRRRRVARERLGITLGLTGVVSELKAP
jgi:hypothetical protein